jgi:hypothetical protein
MWYLEQLARKNGSSELLNVLDLAQKAGSQDEEVLSAKSLSVAQRAELFLD